MYGPAGLGGLGHGFRLPFWRWPSKHRPGPQPARLFGRLRHALRVKHYAYRALHIAHCAYRTEQAYLHWNEKGDKSQWNLSPVVVR